MKTVAFVVGVAFGTALGVGAGAYLWRHAAEPAAVGGAAGDTTPAAGGAGVGAESASEPGSVRLDDATVELLGIQTTAVRAVSVSPTFGAPGRLIVDPSQTCVVRMPLAGRLVGERDLPRLGDAVEAGAELATLLPRLTPVERMDLAQRRASARAERDASIRAVAAAQSDLERQRALHADGNAASQRAVEQAEVEAAAQASRLAAAEQVLGALPEVGPAGGQAGGLGGVTLKAPRAGIVEAVFARLGEEVDAGSVLLQINDPTRLLARIELSAAAAVDPDFVHARLELVGAGDANIDATRQAWVDGGGGDRAVLLAVAASPSDLRPGLPVIAHLPRPGGERAGVQLPETAIVRRGDGAFVYVRTAVAGGVATFQRVPVRLDAAVAGGWMMLPGPGSPAAGADLVTGGASALLSIERQHATDAEAGG